MLSKVSYDKENQIFIILEVLRQSVRQVAGGGAHFRGLAPGQQSSNETSLR